MRFSTYRYRPHHLYEVVVSSPRVWLKIQASCWSSTHATMYLESRFNGTDYSVNGYTPVTPFRLSERAHYIRNWASIVDGLPAGWDDDEFQIDRTPYSWCETLSADCDCHAAKGSLGDTHCSDFGLHGEADKHNRKTENVRYRHYIREMEQRIATRDESARKNRTATAQRADTRRHAPVTPRPAQRSVPPGRARDILTEPLNVVNGLVVSGFYCSIEDRHHAYGEQAVRKTVAELTTILVKAPDRDAQARVLPALGSIGAHLLRANQAQACAQKAVWGDVEIPDILYKYIPRERIGLGAPNSLRATQLLALNDDMECNVTTMKDTAQADTLDFLRVVQRKLKEHLGISVPWEELLIRAIHFGDVRLSTFIQEYLNPRVGVVAFSTDILVPTMWAHYAHNTGIVVGYDADALRTLGYELRPVLYSQIAPRYQPLAGDSIGLDFVNREDVERELRAGHVRAGLPILASTPLAEFGKGWQSLSRLLLVKGMSWAYEKEVRLLVDLEQARDTGKKDANGWPVKVIDPPRQAIKQICHRDNTPRADIERAVEEARGDNRSGLFVGRVSSHAFRMQNTGGTRH